mmetsp:Transcript_6750/g.14759  ORF Transcript_6750/g.14759 Transcript_6750/m.14759 type:complete len:213 (-) Transcript_6750:429-1067(-)
MLRAHHQVPPAALCSSFNPLHLVLFFFLFRQLQIALTPVPAPFSQAQMTLNPPPHCSVAPLSSQLSFHCLVRAPLATPSGPARVFSTAGTLEPLRTHFDALRRRGLSELAAEEVICREHELYVIRSAQMPIWRSWVAQLPVIDEALQQVRQGVLTVAPADRSRQQMTLLYLTSASRFLITSREAQRFHVFLAIVAFSMLSGYMFRRTFEARV